MLGGTDEDLALCLQAEEDRRARDLHHAHAISEELARQLDRGEQRDCHPQETSARGGGGSAPDDIRQLQEDERLARLLAQETAESPSATPPPRYRKVRL